MGNIGRLWLWTLLVVVDCWDPWKCCVWVNSINSVATLENRISVGF